MSSHLFVANSSEVFAVKSLGDAARKHYIDKLPVFDYYTVLNAFQTGTRYRQVVLILSLQIGGSDFSDELALKIIGVMAIWAFDKEYHC